MLGNAFDEADEHWKMAVSKVLASLAPTLHQGDSYDNDNDDDMDEYESDGFQSNRRKGEDEDFKHHGRSKHKRSKTNRSDSNSIKDDDDSGIHSSSSSDYCTSYHQGGDGLSVGGSVTIVSENGGIEATRGDIISVSSETSETIYSADSGSTDLMSQDASTWSGTLSFMSGGKYVM
ncbi:hypothetical protein ACHAXM_000271 [Skeletonema potamos]